MSKYENRNVCH